METAVANFLETLRADEGLTMRMVAGLLSTFIARSCELLKN
jgi:hypothetical protein